MPTYEYLCKACGHEWEKDQKMSDEPVRTCPKCGQEDARRQIGRPSFILKGSGWSSDGYS